jgi:hypothetical protein
MRLHGLLRTRVLRYTAIAVLAFSVGSASVVLAASSGAMQLPVFRLADATNPEQLAKVDAAGSVQVSVNNQPSTQQISGTVSVSNFPATQNVNVTGGTVTTKPSVATRQVVKSFLIEANTGSHTETFTVINASFIHISSDNGIRVLIFGPLGTVLSRLDIDNDHQEWSFTQRIPVTSIAVECHHLVEDCDGLVVIIGD